MAHRRSRISLIAASLYLAFFIAVFLERLIWKVGDATDVIVPAVVALPFGAFGIFYPGGKPGALVVTALAGILNAIAIYWITRILTTGIRRRSGTQI